MDWPSEYRVLATRRGRGVIVAAYFDGIARYLAKRQHGLRYEMVEAPARVAVSGITLPSRQGTWLVKLDVDLPGGRNMAGHGVVGPQVRMRTVAP